MDLKINLNSIQKGMIKLKIIYYLSSTLSQSEKIWSLVLYCIARYLIWY